jgi:hypothetical protein
MSRISSDETRVGDAVDIDSRREVRDLRTGVQHATGQTSAEREG